MIDEPLGDDEGQEEVQEELEIEEAPDVPEGWEDTDEIKFTDLPEAVQNYMRDRPVREVAAPKDDLSSERAALAEKLRVFDQVLSPPDEALNDPDSEQYDPDEYRRQELAFKKKRGEIDKLKGELEAADQQAFQEFKSEQMEIYKSEFPEFLDTKKGPALHRDLIEFAAKALKIDSQTAAETLKQTPARQMMILRDAMRLNKAVAQKAMAKKPAPKVARPGNSKAMPTKDRLSVWYGA